MKPTTTPKTKDNVKNTILPHEGGPSTRLLIAAIIEAGLIANGRNVDHQNQSSERALAYADALIKREKEVAP